jgi:FkbH-like protein
VDAAALRLQQFALAQWEAGMALCLCSKNNEADVWNVFEQNPGMILKRKHLVGWRLNWQPKSENLRSLSEELRLGLDSFVLLDDSPVECAEVESRSPAVAALPAPQSDEELARAIPHWWVFDRPRVTEEDRQRNESYAQEAQREKLREQSGDLEEFLSGLQVEVEIFAPGAEEIPRVAQLTQRTNQFNFTTARQTESETRKAWQEGAAEYLAVRVRDRFGNYGIVGALVFTAGPDELELQNVLLSCRALGRRVEHAMLTRIDELAQERGLKNVSIQFSNSPKNKPAREFLESLGLDCAGTDGGRMRFLFAGGRLSAACAAAPKAETPAPDETNASSSGSVAAPAASGVVQARNSVFRKIAADLSAPLRVMEAVKEAMEAQSPLQRRDAAGYLAPQTELEEQLAGLWAHSLRVDKVGSNDNYFHLGGQSLSSMQVVFKIHDTFGVALPMETFLMSANLAEQARWIEERILLQTDSAEVESIIAEFDSISANSTGGTV